MKMIDIGQLSAEDRELVGRAKEARSRAYAPYSNYKVGAAVRADNDVVFAGCNVENATYNATHAERNALDGMVAQGIRKIAAVAVVSENGGFPCAECRQAIWEFCNDNPQVKIIGCDAHGHAGIITIGELYPYPFGPSDLGIEVKN